MGVTIDFVGGRRARLGESPVWDPDLKVLFWVDTVGAEIVRHDLVTGLERAYPAPGKVGCVVLGPFGSLIAGVEDRVLRLDVETSAFEELFRVVGQAPQVRLNDGKTDRQGRLLIGSMGALPDGTPPAVCTASVGQGSRCCSRRSASPTACASARAATRSTSPTAYAG